MTNKDYVKYGTEGKLTRSAMQQIIVDLTVKNLVLEEANALLQEKIDNLWDDLLRLKKG